MRKFKFYNPLIRSEVWANNSIKENSFLIFSWTLYKEKDGKPVLKGKDILSSKKEWTNDVCSKMDESQDHYADCKKPNTKEYILYDCIYFFI